ncbi:MAG: DEAD/DEAH box helicase [Phycisphaerales bacterium]|nr:DEAD/DEAH box helicase [Phycisphaerales bacterium]
MTDQTQTVQTPFSDLGLRGSVSRGVAEAGFEQPTEIQAQIIPPILAGRDVLGQARTGTGKTAAFGLPLLHLGDPDVPSQALILVPTRELAMQVDTELKKLGRYTPIRSQPIYGGQRLRSQIAEFEKRRPNLIVGTPGRVMDLHQRGVLSYDNIKRVVLDEVDRMLDIGFREDIRKILGGVKRPAQFVFVSATITEEIETLARKYMTDPVKIVTAEGALTVRQVEQKYLAVQPWDKRALLLHLLKHEEPDLTLVFCRTKDTVDRLAQFLARHQIEVHSLHGDMPQSKRNSIVRKLRSGHLSVVVASDLAARGLDVTGISHVINFDLPEDPEVYIHRIGRTARAGKSGIAWSFVAPDQGKLLTAIEMLANIEIAKLDYPDFVPGPIPEDKRAQIAKPIPEAEAPLGRAAGPDAVWEDERSTIDEEKFPGGVVPSGPPKRRLGGRMKTRRGR